MAEQATLPTVELIDHAAVDRAHAAANNEALLEHARMGRSVCEGRDGKVVWITPAEIFARYGLDEFGRPKPEPKEEPVTEDDPLLVAQMDDWRWLDELRNEGKLEQYRGEYVLAAARQIFAHGRNLVGIRPAAEQRACEQGIDPNRIIDYFMPGEL